MSDQQPRTADESIAAAEARLAAAHAQLDSDFRFGVKLFLGAAILLPLAMLIGVVLAAIGLI